MKLGLIYSSALGIVAFTVLKQFNEQSVLFEGEHKFAKGKGGGEVRKSVSSWWSIWNISIVL